MTLSAPKLHDCDKNALSECVKAKQFGSGFQYLWTSIAALVGMSLLGVCLTFWLAAETGSAAALRWDVPVGAWVLQALITGNLAVGLLWIWLDVRIWRLLTDSVEIRGILCFCALLLLIGLTWFSLALAEDAEGLLIVLLFAAIPTSVLALPLLWATVRRIQSARLGTLVLAAFGAATALAQEYAGDSRITSDESFLVVNSCLIGLAIAIWLVTWAAIPQPRRTA